VAEVPDEAPQALRGHQGVTVLAGLLQGLERLIIVMHLTVRPAQRVAGDQRAEQRLRAGHGQREAQGPVPQLDAGGRVHEHEAPRARGVLCPPDPRHRSRVDQRARRIATLDRARAGRIRIEGLG
ncbi:MAG: hypothetical protein ACK56I_10220, partial [bacterium]